MKTLINKYEFRFLIFVTLILCNIGLVFNLFQDTNYKFFSFNNEEDILMPYIDDGCKYSQLELTQRINHIEKKFNNEIVLNFYEHPTNMFCQGKPVFSNNNYQEFQNNESLNFSIGIGTNKDLDNIELLGKFLSLFFVITYFINGRKYEKNREIILNMKALLSFVILALAYTAIVFPSIKSGFTDFLFPVLVGNLLFFKISQYFPTKSIFISIVILSIFPLFFYNTNITFFWLIICYTFNLNIKLSKKDYFYLSLPFLVMLMPFLINFNNYYFEKNQNLFEYILFQNGRHKGGIVNIGDGFQVATYIVDIIVIFIVFYFLVLNTRNYEFSQNQFFDALLLGFLIWLVSYIFSQINPHINYFILKILGLPEAIDTINTVHEDGINWRGITPSHELTGFWLAIISSLATFQYFMTKKKIYLIYLALSLVSLSYNSQRTALILFIITAIFIFFKNKNVDKKISVTFFMILVASNIIFPAGFERAISRFQNLNLEESKITNYHKEKIADSFNRFEEYNIQYIEKPSYNFDELETLSQFYEIELGTTSNLLIKPVIFTAKVFGREVQWMRFMYFNDLEVSQYIFGKGPSQSYEVLDLLIEKPHSLYLTIFYQYGFFGLFLILLLIFKVMKNFVKYKFQFIDLLCILFFINGIKNEFLFTHNQVVFFILFFVYVLNIKSKNRIK